FSIITEICTLPMGYYAPTLNLALHALLLIHFVGASCFSFFLFSVHSVNRLKVLFLSVRTIVLSFFLVAWGIFENFFSRVGQAHSLAGFGLRVGSEWPANVCD